MLNEISLTKEAITALLSCSVGFGIAAYLFMKIFKTMLSKPQKMLVLIAMSSFGIGTTGIVNELVGVVVFGWGVKEEKIIQFIVANVLFVPTVFLLTAFILRNRSRRIVMSTWVDQKLKVTAGNKISRTSNVHFPRSYWGISESSILRYRYHLTGLIFTISIFSALLLFNVLSDVKFDVYNRENNQNCSSNFSKDPVRLSFQVSDDLRKVFGTMTYHLEKRLFVLEGCHILNSKNWTCKDGPYQMVDGELKIELRVNSCEPKVVRRHF